jgi:hypothetical protein
MIIKICPFVLHHPFQHNYCLWTVMIHACVQSLFGQMTLPPLYLNVDHYVINWTFSFDNRLNNTADLMQSYLDSCLNIGLINWYIFLLIPYAHLLDIQISNVILCDFQKLNEFVISFVPEIHHFITLILLDCRLSLTYILSCKRQNNNVSNCKRLLYKADSEEHNVS